jgi:hypothetical protein
MVSLRYEVANLERGYRRRKQSQSENVKTKLLLQMTFQECWGKV